MLSFISVSLMFTPSLDHDAIVENRPGSVTEPDFYTVSYNFFSCFQVP